MDERTVPPYEGGTTGGSAPGARLTPTWPAKYHPS